MSQQPNQTKPSKPERLLRLPEVEALSGLKKTTIYQGAHAGTFPKPLRLSARCVAWRESDIATWQAQRLQALGVSHERRGGLPERAQRLCGR